VTDDEIFAGLDGLPWAEVEHCWGPAVDTPAHLRDLRSPRAELRGGAAAELCTSIYHLGRRFPATHLAVPFLARVAIAPDSSHRQHLIELLTALAVGDADEHFPAGFDVDGAREWLAELRAHTAESWERHLDTWIAAADNRHERRDREARRPHWTLADSLRDAESEVRAYEAVRACVPALRRLLWDADEEVQAAAACLLAWFPEEADGSVAALTALLADVPPPSVAVDALVALGLLSETSAAVIAPFLGNASTPVSWAAAIALTVSGAADPAVVTKLDEAIASGGSAGPTMMAGRRTFAHIAARCRAPRARGAAPMV
jgi:hypothetical protein